MLFLEDTILFFVGAVLVAIISGRFRVSETIGLGVLGLIVAALRQEEVLFRGRAHFEVTREIVLTLFLPPLLFAGALNLRWRMLLRHSPVILTLSSVGTLGSVLLIAAASKALIGWPWEAALLLGVIVSATDPMNLHAPFRNRPVPEGLGELVGGESLFSSGLSVILSLILLRGIAQGWETIDASSEILGFLWMGLGGFLVGASLGALGNRILGRLHDPLVEVMISLVLAFGSALVAEHLDCSGVIAVIFAGLLFGNPGKTQRVSPTVLSRLTSNWRLFAFLANAIVFFALGFQLDLASLVDHLGAIVAIFFAMIVARALLTYGIAGSDVQWRRAYPGSWVPVLHWGGLKGAIPVALSLGIGSVPGLEDHSSSIPAITFGVVLLSLLLQGLTLTPLLSRLGLSEPRKPQP